MKLKYLFALVLSFSTQAWAFGDTYRGDYTGFNYMINAGAEHTCLLDLRGVKCWGRNDYGQTKVPILKSPIQVSAGGSHTCALDIEGVKCWGRNDYGQTNVPTLKSPIQVSAGDLHTCALDAEGVKCWGSNDSGQTNVPILKSATQISAGGAHTCALTKSGVKCWGWNLSNQTDVPPLKSPIQVSAGASHTCALDKSGVKCWGWNLNNQTTKVPTLKSPIQISAGGYHTCALDAEGVKCWGENEYGETNVPILKSATQISAGGAHTCALDIEGVKCWGSKGNGRTKVPPTFIISDLIDGAIPYVSSTRAEYLKGVANFKVDVKSESYYLKLLLVTPTILSVESSFFVEAYIPKFKNFVDSLQKKFAYTGDIREVPEAEENRKLAIASIESALSVSLSFISDIQQSSIQNSLRAAGAALAEPMNNQKIRELIVQIDALTTEKQKLKSSQKSAFLVDTLELAANWLREKVK